MRAVAALIASVLLTGCASTGWMYAVPDEPAFNPAPTVQNVKITFIQSENPSETCRKMFPSSLGGFRVMLACAGWTEDRTQCTIVTGLNPLPEVVGHELRHCFEGAFHG